MEIGRKLKKLHEIENCHLKLVVAELGEVFLHFRYPIVQDEKARLATHGRKAQAKESLGFARQMVPGINLETFGPLCGR